MTDSVISITRAIEETAGNIAALEKAIAEEQKTFFSMNPPGTPSPAIERMKKEIQSFRGVQESFYAQLEQARKAENEAAAQKAQELESTRAAFEASEKANALQVWTSGGGTPEAFEAAWPGIWAEKLRRAVLDHKPAPVDTSHLYR